MTPEQFVINCAIQVIEGHEFKLSGVLDVNRRCIPHKNSMDMRELYRALMILGRQ